MAINSNDIEAIVKQVLSNMKTEVPHTCNCSDGGTCSCKSGKEIPKTSRVPGA